MSKERSKAWLPRASNQFARSVYHELRRAGHDKGDIVRFVNELMGLMLEDKTPEPPSLITAEAGLPGSDTMHDILEFELRNRPRDRRSGERLAVVAIDVVLPSWTCGETRQRTHESIHEAISGGLRTGDSLGQLGPDRYLLVLPRCKEGVALSIHARIARALDGGGLAEGLVLEFRWAMTSASSPEPVPALEMLQQCFAAEAVAVRPTAGTPAPRRPDEVVRAARPRDHTITLALGGGAARAVSHAGVLSELAAAHIRPVAIAGCSAGAMVGAMIARGITPEAIGARFIEFSRTPLYAAMRRGYAAFLRATRPVAGRSRTRYFGASNLAFYSDAALSAFSNDDLAAFVEHFVGPDCDIATLRIPYSAVAADLVEGRAINLSHGSLHEVVAASCAVPGLFPPQRAAERLLVDGSSVTEVPIWSAQLLGVSAPILAVHMGRPFRRIPDYHTSTEVSTRTNALIHAELVREQLRRADLLLTIPMDDVGWLDFRRADDIVERGRRATADALPRITAHLSREQADPVLD